MWGGDVPGFSGSSLRGFPLPPEPQGPLSQGTAQARATTSPQAACPAISGPQPDRMGSTLFVAD